MAKAEVAALFIPGALALPGDLLAGRGVDVADIQREQGVAVVPDDTGGTLVYLLSDDNFNPAQRTLLMVFRLIPPA